MTAWFYLCLAIGLEVTGTFLLKISDGFENWIWGVSAIGCYSACFWVLAPAMSQIPIGVVYAIWAGVGIVAATALGHFVFNEHLSVIQLAFIAMILVGSVGLRLESA